ncbi:MAG: hypothetical protein C4311_03030 [Chloroflexota bacterium]
MMRTHTRWQYTIHIALLSVIVIFLLFGRAQAGAPDGKSISTVPRLYLPLVLDRPVQADGVGLGGPHKMAVNPQLWGRFRWIYNWITVGQGFGDWPGYRPMIWGDGLEWYGGAAGIRWFATRWPGRQWLFLNEPERASQANLPPGYAAQVVASHRDLVTGADPTATWGCCGVQVDATGMAWLDRYIDAEGPVGDFWHIHIYGVEDCNPASSLQVLHNFEAWAEARGITRPILITEFGCLFSGPPQRACDYIANIVPALRADSLVTGWAWWSSGDGTYPLFDDQGNPTEVGQCYLNTGQR